MSYSEKLRVAIETLKDEEKVAVDMARGATGDMSDDERSLHELRALVFGAAILALQPILEEREEEGTDGSATDT